MLLQCQSDDSFCASVTAVLKEVEIEGPVRISCALGDGEFSAEPRLLRRTTFCKGEQDRIKETAVDAGTLPAGIEVARTLFRSRETPIKVDTPATCAPERIQPSFKTGKQQAPARRKAIAVDNFRPCRFVDPRRQQAGLRIDSRNHNTILMLCFLLVKPIRHRSLGPEKRRAETCHRRCSFVPNPRRKSH